MTITQQDVDVAQNLFCYPTVLLINFALCQYLTTIYYSRRREWRVVLLIFCSFVSFVIIMPFAVDNDVQVGELNDISETASTLTFLIQITIIGRDIQRKMKIRSVKYLTYVAEFLILFGIFIMLDNLIELLFPSINLSALHELDNEYECASLAFIVFFRFYYMALSRGTKWLIDTKKVEIGLYLLFMTHEYPFMVLQATTSVSWESVQAVWNRVTLLMCILVTIRDKLRDRLSQESGVTVNATSEAPITESIRTHTSGRQSFVAPRVSKPISNRVLVGQL